MIADLQLERIKRGTHITGETLCMSCGQRETTIAPVGVVWLECSACGAHRSTWVYPACNDEDLWTCSCDNQLFYITPTKVVCPNCGTQQEGFDRNG